MNNAVIDYLMQDATVDDLIEIVIDRLIDGVLLVLVLLLLLLPFCVLLWCSFVFVFLSFFTPLLFIFYRYQATGITFDYPVVSRLYTRSSLSLTARALPPPLPPSGVMCFILLSVMTAAQFQAHVGHVRRLLVAR